MSGFARGDVVLVPFLFSEGTGVKLRPALVLSSSGYHRGRQEIIVAAITGNVRRRLFGDQAVADWKTAGLLFPSVVTGILRTVKQSMLERRLGALAQNDLAAVEAQLRRSLDL
jgi:mRNA interferase MazF